MNKKETLQEIKATQYAFSQVEANCSHCGHRMIYPTLSTPANVILQEWQEGAETRRNYRYLKENFDRMVKAHAKIDRRERIEYLKAAIKELAEDDE